MPAAILVACGAAACISIRRGMLPDLPAGLWPLLMRLAVGDEVPTALSPDAFHRLLACATEEGLLPLLCHDPLVPASVREALIHAPAIRSLYLRRLDLHRQAARALVDTVGADSCVFVKGFEYRYRLYSRPELRPSADIDVFVPPGRIDDVVARLQSAGYRLASSEGEALWGTGYYEVGVDIGEVRVEIHRTFGHAVRTAVDYEEIWAKREVFRAGDFEARRLAPLHAMGLHVLNLAKDEFSSPLIRFVDLFLMLRLWPEEIVPLTALARRWRIEGGLYGSLRLATALFPEAGTEVVAEAMESLLTPGARRFLDRHVLPDRLRTSSGHVDGRAMQLWRKLWLTDGAGRRVSFCGLWAWRFALLSVRAPAAARGAKPR